MIYIYSFLYELIYLLARGLSPFSKVLNDFFHQRKTIAKDLVHFSVSTTDTVFWVHCASMGEFEQIRPLLEKITKEFPKAKRLVSFFSVSGYQIHKDTPLAEAVCYLPLDRKKDLNEFLNHTHPTALLLVKYEFWPNLLHIVKKRGIPVFSISSNFRPKQVFFHTFSWGTKKLLHQIDHFFVLNKKSKELLASLGISKVTVSGDTRFDRVLETYKAKVKHQKLDHFLNGKKTFVAGSTWPEDHRLICPQCNENSDFKWIIAPHKIDPAAIAQLEKHLKIPFAKWSSYNDKRDGDKNVLILDCIGVLSSAYHYGAIAYIGGGMGKKGLHNTLEAAVFGLPIIIGKHFRNFPEAIDLIKLGGMISVKNPNQFKRLLEKLSDKDLRKTMGAINHNYIQKAQGASQKIIYFLKKWFNL